MPNKLPIIKTIALAKGLSSTPKRSTVGAPKGTIINDFFKIPYTANLLR
tara:strand:+ start:695 stop:841 length:147 start_codon:yes stop_codon:yes gene_type:complete